MIRLYYSNYTERLLEALLGELGEERRRPGRSVLEPSHLIVPNRNVETFVKFGLARATGLAANLEVGFLRRFVSELAEMSRPGTQVVDSALLQGLCLSLLCDDKLLRDEELEPVRAYLHAAGESADAIDLRRVQLAMQLAHLFDEYGLSRPELLLAWRKNATVVLPDELRATERWQRRLWRALFAPRGLVDKRGRARGVEWQTLAAIYRDLDAGELRAPKAIHVFGLSYVARLFQEIFHKLGQKTDVYLYTLNPCAEFWEDVEHLPGIRESRRFPSRAVRGQLDGDDGLDAQEDPFQLVEPGDTMALRLWGRPGRENIRLLNELTECTFVPAFEDPTLALPTLLARLQRHILYREPEPAPLVGGSDADDDATSDADSDASARDTSLRLFACPGVRRELEVIAAEIWRLVREDPTLRFNEIAVIVPGGERQSYLAHLQAVFRETHELPHNVVDLQLASESRLVEAVLLLLALPLGSFGRQDLLRLLTHPSLMARFPDATTDEWLGWCESLGILHGADHDDHAGTYIDRDILNWDQGLRRLALGAFMTGRRSGEEQPFDFGGQAYLPEELPSGRLASAAGFQLLSRSLIEDARFARGARLSLQEWIRFLRGLLSSYVVPVGVDDERVLGRCLAELDALESVDLDARAVSYRIPYELLQRALSGLTASRGQYLADGVVVSSFLPMRAIPFRAVFIAGLGEGQFPTSERLNHLDLRLAKRRPGDVTAREQDKYLFLETLLCARERLTLSYVARDPLTGDLLEPSSVIVELEEILRGFLPPSALATFRERFPLGRHEDPHTCAASPPAAREAQAQALGDDLRAFTGRDDDQTLGLHALKNALPPALYARLTARLGLAPVPPRVAVDSDGRPASDGDADEKLAVPVSALRRFLECPLQGSASFMLRMREETDEDVTARADELFATPRLDELSLLREVFLRALADGGSSLDEAQLFAGYDRAAALGALRGEMPSGLFAVAERSGHLDVLGSWLDTLRKVAPEGAPTGVRTFRFGHAEEHAIVDTLHDPIVLPLVLPTPGGGARRVQVELYGKTEAIVESLPGSIVLVDRGRGAEADVRNFRDSLKGFFDHALLAAAGLAPAAGREHAVYVAPGRRRAEPHVSRFAALSAEDARAWLSAVAGDLLSGVHSYLLPCEAVYKLKNSKTPMTVLAAVDALRENSRWGGSYSSKYGPVRHADRFEPPEEAIAQAMIEKRFGPFFARLQRDDAKRKRA